MDISREYIKMCHEAKEIQKLWKFSKRSSGDWYFNIPLNAVYTVSGSDQKDKDCIWIPRQDQLQKMLKSRYTTLEEIWKYFAFQFYPVELDSFEKLWIAFVMKKKHNKTWDGEQWKVCEQ